MTEDFPLTIWEGTDEALAEHGAAKERLKKLQKVWKEKYGGDPFVADFRFDINGFPEFWMDDRGVYATGRVKGISRKEALQSALKWGATGFWHLEDLEQLIDGEGIIIEEVMFSCGFVKEQGEKNKWVKKKEDGLRPEFRRQRFMRAITYDEILKEELQRLNGLWVAKNDYLSPKNEYSARVGSRGMISAEIPGLSNVMEILEQNNIRSSPWSHIAKQQEGFYIEARNVKLYDELGIHIKAVRPDKSYIECVWPTKIILWDTYNLARELVKRVNEKC